MKTHLWLLVLGSEVWVGAAIALAASPELSPPRGGPVVLSPGYITALVEELRTNHPALRAVAARTNAAGAHVASIKTWDDPMVRLGGMGARTMMRAEDGDLLYGLEQKLPVFGKPRLARRVAEAELAATQAVGEATFQQLRSDLARALYRAALAERVVELGHEDLAWLNLLTRSVEEQYRAGRSSQFDLMLVQNQRAARADRLETERQNLANERVGVNRLLARDLEAPWASLRLPGVASPLPEASRLVEFALRYEARLAVQRREVAAAESMVRLTRRERWPEVNLGVGNRTYTGDGSYRALEVMLSVSLPWGNARRYRSAIARDESRLHAAELDLQDLQLEVEREVRTLVFLIDAARRESVLYRDELLPRAGQALAAARAAWENGRGLLRDVLDARRMLVEAQLMEAKALAEQHERLAELVLCCGLGDLEALQMLGVTAAPPSEPPSSSRP